MNQPYSVVIVTGGTRGIGRAIVKRLHQEGFAVLLTFSNATEEADNLISELAESLPAVRKIQADIQDSDSAARIFDMAEAMGTVVGLVNNAGVTGQIGPITQLTEEDLQLVITVNLVGPVRLCREAARRWASSREPRPPRRSIINISSIAAKTGAPNEYVSYAATKAAIETLSIGLAKELAASGVMVNAISPGTIDTTIHARAGRPARAKEIANRIPLGRPGQPEEIANAVAWLMSPDSSYVTGAVLTVAGGL